MNNNMGKNNNPGNQNTYNKQRKNNSNDNGKDAFGRNLSEKIDRSKQKATRGAIRNAINSFAPGMGTAVDKILETEKGKELVDEFAKGSNPAEGVKNVLAKVKSNQQKKIIMFFSVALGGILIMIMPMVFIASIFKNADTKTYSVNGGKVDENLSGDYPDESVFARYPGLYEQVEINVKRVSDEFHVEVDIYLVLATLLAPIENELIVPYKNGRCGGDRATTDCYKFENKWYTWEDYLYNLAGQAEYLAKAQILTYYNTKGEVNLGVSCNSEQTMEVYATNDSNVNEWQWWYIFNPLRWFDTYKNAAEAEVNAKCLDIPVGESDTKPIYVISKDEGTYYCDRSKTHSGCTYVKDSNTGGVYFWNLVNQNGIIHTYFKDYLAYIDDEDDGIDDMYEENLPQILDIAKYIYSYYEDIRRDCKDYNVIESTIKYIKVKQPNGNIEEVELEHYVGGVVSSEIADGTSLTVNNNVEAVIAFAVLARSYAIGSVGTDGNGVINNGSSDQNYNSNYNPEANERHKKIAELVALTKGIVVTGYNSYAVRKTSYDSFCPVSAKEKNGFYYTPDNQNFLPINSEFFYQKTGIELKLPMSRVGNCACYKNMYRRPGSVRPEDFYREVPSNIRECYNGPKANGLLEYSPNNGHGRGASQYGLRYFAPMGYSWEALIKLFYDLTNMRGGEQYTALKRLSSSIDELECDYALPQSKGTTSTCGISFNVTDSNYTDTLNPGPISTTLTQALEKGGYNVECLNECVSQRVAVAGYGTREGVVEASVGLLQCMKEMTGRTLPYSHDGWPRNGSMGVNIQWGTETTPTMCEKNFPCLKGLNCATSVGWAMCNGGMNFCSRGSTFASEMTLDTKTVYYPGAIRIYLNGGGSTGVSPDKTVGSLNDTYRGMLSKYSSGTKLSSIPRAELLNLVQIGDTLYSNSFGGGSAHAMLVVGTDNDAIYVAENGRKLSKITRKELISNSKYYVFSLLEDWYSNNANVAPEYRGGKDTNA